MSKKDRIRYTEAMDRTDRARKAYRKATVRKGESQAAINAAYRAYGAAIGVECQMLRDA